MNGARLFVAQIFNLLYLSSTSLAGTMQINFNAKSQRFKGAKANTDFDFTKRLTF